MPSRLCAIIIELGIKNIGNLISFDFLRIFRIVGVFETEQLVYAATNYTNFHELTIEFVLIRAIFTLSQAEMCGKK